MLYDRSNLNIWCVASTDFDVVVIIPSKDNMGETVDVLVVGQCSHRYRTL